MAETLVGARLDLSGAQAFAASADTAIEKLDAITAAADRAGASLKAVGVEGGIAMDAAAGGAGTGARADAVAADASAVAAAEQAKRSEIEKTTTAVEGAAKKQTGIVESMAGNHAVKTLATWGTGALAVGAYETVKQYAAFNQAITQSAVDAGMNPKNLKAVQAQALEITRQTGVSAMDVANTVYRVQSALSGTHDTLKQVMATVKDAANLDVLFNIPKGNASEQSARVMGAMMFTQLQGAKTPQQIMALINSGVGHGDIRGADMIAALGKLLPAAKAMGGNAADMISWVDTLTKSGMQGSQAGTLIAHSVQQLAEPSEQGNKAEQMLGIQGGQLKNMLSTQGIPKTIQFLTNAMKQFDPTSTYPKFSTDDPGRASALAQLQAWGIASQGQPVDPTVAAQYKKLGMAVPSALSDNTLADFQSGKMNKTESDQIQSALLSKIFGGAKGALPMLALMNSPSGYAELTKAIKDGATQGALAADLNRAMNTPARQMQIARANIAASGIQIGQELTPAATEFLRILGDTAKYLADHKAVLDGILGSLALIVGSAVTVEGISKLQRLGKGLADISNTLSNSKLGQFLGAGSGNVEQSAADMQLRAAEMQLEAAGAGKGGVGAAGVGGAGAAGSSALGAAIGKGISGAIIGAVVAYVADQGIKKILGPGRTPTDNANALVASLTLGGMAAGSRFGPLGVPIGGTIGAGVGIGIGMNNFHNAQDQVYGNLESAKWLKNQTPAQLNAYINSSKTGGGLLTGSASPASMFLQYVASGFNAKKAGLDPRMAAAMAAERSYDETSGSAWWSPKSFTAADKRTNANRAFLTQWNAASQSNAGSVSPAEIAAFRAAGWGANSNGTPGNGARINHSGRGETPLAGSAKIMDVLTKSSSGLKDAADKHKDAAQKHTEAAAKLKDSADASKSAAKTQLDAAAKIFTAADKLSSAAESLQNLKINANIDIPGLASALQANSASATARG